MKKCEIIADTVSNEEKMLLGGFELKKSQAERNTKENCWRVLLVLFLGTL